MERYKMMAMQYKNKVPPITVAEAITIITVTPDAPNSLLSDWSSKYGVIPVKVTTTAKRMKHHPTKKQLQRAKQYQRRTQ